MKEESNKNPEPKTDKKHGPVLKELHQALEAHGDLKTGKPKCLTTGQETPYDPPQVTADEEIRRLLAWLKMLEASPQAFAALLQIWLDHHGVYWPQKVFSYDVRTPGRGRKPATLESLEFSSVRSEAWRLKSQEGLTHGQIADQLYPVEDKKEVGRRRRLKEKVRNAARNAPKSVRSADLAVRATAELMLGLEHPHCEE